jgi:hypothetical protein
MDKLKNNLKLDNLKLLVPNLYNTSKDKLSSAISPMLKSEADYLMKTENSDKELLDLLISKMDIEVILGLKFILSVLFIYLVYHYEKRCKNLYNKCYKFSITSEHFRKEAMSLYNRLSWFE